MKYYIYTLEYEGIPFYVGKTIKLNERFNKHIFESKLKRTYKEKFINKIIMKNQTIFISILDEVEIGTENYFEKYWIEQLKQWGFKLTNATSGGEGGDYWSGKTHTQNTKNKLSKIRYEQIKKGKIHPMPGELNGRSKLTNDQVIEIRKLRNEKKYSYRKLSLKFNVSKTTIIDIIKRKKWKHI
jgi:hypothetical protein